MAPAALRELRTGEVVGDRFKVTKKLGQGGFGAVYKVEDGAKEFALKIESNFAKTPVLMMDIFVLDHLGKADNGPNKHFCTVFGKGRTSEFNYLVMTLVGQSLQDLRKTRKDQYFSLSSAVRAGAQCLKALEQLHMFGYLHRDLKPGNYAVGRPEEHMQRSIFLIDFGMCRRYLSEGRIRTPRSRAGFRGTVRYASLACHRGKELSPRDDVETWFYQQVEITKGALPWKYVNDRHQVGNWKEDARTLGHPTRKELLAGCPHEYDTLFKHICALEYDQVPKYTLIFAALTRVMDLHAYSDDDPFDWETPEQHAAHLARRKPSPRTPATTEPKQSRSNERLAARVSADALADDAEPKARAAAPTAPTAAAPTLAPTASSMQPYYGEQPKPIPLAVMLAAMKARQQK